MKNSTSINSHLYALKSNPLWAQHGIDELDILELFEAIDEEFGTNLFQNRDINMYKVAIKDLYHLIEHEVNVNNAMKLYIKKIEKTCRKNLFGESITSETQYYICIKRFFGLDVNYMLICNFDRQHNLYSSNEVEVHWMDDISNATSFTKKEAEDIIKMVQTNPNRFVLA